MSGGGFQSYGLEEHGLEQRQSSEEEDAEDDDAPDETGQEQTTLGAVSEDPDDLFHVAHEDINMEDFCGNSATSSMSLLSSIDDELASDKKQAVIEKNRKRRSSGTAAPTKSKRFKEEPANDVLYQGLFHLGNSVVEAAKLNAGSSGSGNNNDKFNSLIECQEKMLTQSIQSQQETRSFQQQQLQQNQMMQAFQEQQLMSNQMLQQSFADLAKCMMEKNK
jgi:hypothetical protein